MNLYRVFTKDEVSSTYGISNRWQPPTVRSGHCTMSVHWQLASSYDCDLWLVGQRRKKNHLLL